MWNSTHGHTNSCQHLWCACCGSWVMLAVPYTLVTTALVFPAWSCTHQANTFATDRHNNPRKPWGPLRLSSSSLFFSFSSWCVFNFTAMHNTYGSYITNKSNVLFVYRITCFDFFCRNTFILHLWDVLFSVTMFGMGWNWLKWSEV